MAQAGSEVIEGLLEAAISQTGAASGTLYIRVGVDWAVHTRMQGCDTSAALSVSRYAGTDTCVASSVTAVLTCVAQAREPCLVPEVTTAAHDSGGNLQLAMYVPLLQNSDVWGILELSGDALGSDVAAYKQTTVVLLCRQAMLLLRHAQHYAELQNRSTAIEESMDGMAVLESGHFIYLNRAHAEMFGYDTVADLIGQPWQCLYRPEQIAVFESEIFPVLNEHGSWRGVSMGLRRDGSTFHEEVTLVRHPEGQLVCICRDITERLNAEETIRQKSLALEHHSRDLEAKVVQRTAELTEAIRIAERANKAKGLFLANMSHELRTPLNGVLGMLALLEGTNPTPAQQDYVRIARKSGTHLLALISDVLDFSKIDAGKLVLDPTDVRLRDIVEDVLDITADHAFQKGLNIAAFIDTSLPHCIHVDAGRLRQVLLNLLNNAIKFTERGEVAISVRSGPLGTSETLVIAVTDTGIGLDRDQQALIFDAFSQADNAHATSHGGAGLGLTICKGLLEAMGGHIEVESTPAAGTTFRAHLPLIRGQVQDSLPPTPTYTGLTALIADPHAGSRHALHQALVSYQMDDLEADSCETARQILCDTDAVSMLFLDQALIQHEPAPELLQTVATRRCHLVLLTRLGQTHAETVSDLNAAAVLTKPVRWHQLASLLESAFGIHKVATDPKTGRSSSQHLPSYRGRVLVVDDVETNVHVLREMLRLRGCTTDIAMNGQAAIEAVQNHAFDLVMMDCQMPGMDGFEATARIRTLNTTLPIVAVTAGVLAGEKAKCLEAGMNDYLPKPVNIDKLDSILTRWLAFTPAAGSEASGKPATPTHRPVSPERASAAVTAIINREQIDMLMTIMTAAEFEHLVNAYCENAALFIGSLRIAHNSSQMEEVTRMAHKLAGTSGTIGATSVVTYCTELERLARAGEVTPETATLIVQIEAAFCDARSALSGLVAQSNLVADDA